MTKRCWSPVENPRKRAENTEMAPKATNKFYWHMRRRNTPLLSLCSAFRHNIGFCYVIGAKLLPAKNTQVCTQYSGVRFKSFPWYNIIFVIDTYLFSNENHGEKWKYKIFGALNNYYNFYITMEIKTFRIHPHYIVWYLIWQRRQFS